MVKIHCYILTRCPFCVAAKNLLDDKELNYTETIVDHDSNLWQEMIDKSGHRTAPQIFINSQPIGGYTDLKILEDSGKLDQLLAE